MMSEIEKYINDFFSEIYSKEELDQASFDLSLISEHLGYQNIVGNKSKKASKERENTIRAQIEELESEHLKKLFISRLNKADISFFEPGHFKIFCEEFENKVKQTVYFRVTVAMPLLFEDLKRIADKMTKNTQRKVVIDIHVDKKIIGGAIIKKDNYILDFSLRTKLNNFEKKWKEAITSSRERNAA